MRKIFDNIARLNFDSDVIVGLWSGEKEYIKFTPTVKTAGNNSAV